MYYKKLDKSNNIFETAYYKNKVNSTSGSFTVTIDFSDLYKYKDVGLDNGGFLSKIHDANKILTITVGNCGGESLNINARLIFIRYKIQLIGYIVDGVQHSVTSDFNYEEYNFEDDTTGKDSNDDTTGKFVKAYRVNSFNSYWPKNTQIDIKKTLQLIYITLPSP